MAAQLGRLVTRTARNSAFSRRIPISAMFKPFSTSADNNFHGLTDYQLQLKESVSQFLEKELAPFSEKIDKEDNFPQLKEFLKKCGDMGISGITVPEEYGGLGGGFMDYVLVGEEFGRISPSIALSFGAHTNLCINQIARCGSHEQKMKYLPQLLSGEHLGALAMSEPQAGSDVMSMRLQADRQGDYFILNGTKMWITNAPDADVVIVYAKTDPHSPRPQHGITCFIIEGGMEGFSRGKKLDKLGIRGSGTGELVFENCKVPVSNVMGGVNKGTYVLMSGLDIERLILAALPVGLMQSAVDIAFPYLHTREAFNQKIGHFQLMQAKMADMYTKLSASRSYLYAVARACDNGHINSRDCAAVVLFAAENATQVALDAIQCLGGNGYINDFPTGRLLRDAKLFEIGGGTSEIRRLLIGRSFNEEYR